MMPKVSSGEDGGGVGWWDKVSSRTVTKRRLALCPSPSSTSLTGVCVRVLNVVPQEGDDGSIARLCTIKGDDVAKLGRLERADEGMTPEHFLGLQGEEGKGQRKDERSLSAS